MKNKKDAFSDYYEVLANGALVLKGVGPYVLAAYRGEFVTWVRDAEDSAHVSLGHYFTDIEAAVKDLQKRIDTH